MESSQTKQILLVDDEPVALMVAQKMLEHEHFSVVTAATGAEAIEKFEQTPTSIGVVMIDMILPDMRGSELLERLRSIDPVMKAIICSGYSLNSEIEEMLSTGNITFLQKPYSAQMLYSTITEMFEL